jgi:hypothetical protein
MDERERERRSPERIEKGRGKFTPKQYSVRHKKERFGFTN